MNDGQGQSKQRERLSERQRTKIQGRFGTILLLLIATVFFSIAAPDEPWAWLATALVLAANLRTAMLASDARPKVVRAWSVVASSRRRPVMNALTRDII